MNGVVTRSSWYKDANTVLALVTCLVGIIAGWGISYDFYRRSASDLIQEATADGKEKGRAEGHAQGMKEGLAAAKANEPKMIEERYPEMRRQAHDLGFAEGLAKGKADGVEEGRQQGLVQGKQEAQQQYTYQSYAEKNWFVYSRKVLLVAGIADRLDKEPGNKRILEYFLAEVQALTQSAESLRNSYAAQATAFNSAMSELQAALSSQDLTSIKKLARTVRGTMETKEALFKQANQTTASTFDAMERRPDFPKGYQ